MLLVENCRDLDMMIIRSILLFGLVGSVFSEGVLPNYMLGKFKLYKSADNYDDFMEALGVGWLNRQLALSLTPTHEIRQDGDTISMTISTLLYSGTVKFKLDEKYEETNPLGGTIPALATLVDGNKLKRNRYNDDGSLKFYEERTYTDGGNKYKLKIEIPGKVTSYRYFKRIED